mgnify:CR=1 FL=1
MYGLDEFTLREVVARSGEIYAEKPVSAMTGKPAVTYERFARSAVRLAGRLAGEYGIGKGDRVAILGENRPEWGVAYFAVTAMGAVAVPILTEFSSEQIGNIIKHAGCRGIIVSRRFREKATGIEGIGGTDIADSPGGVNDTTGTADTPAGFFHLDMENGPLPAPDDNPAPGGIPANDGPAGKYGDSCPGGDWSGFPAVGEEDLAAIIYTSGTTGSSKGVMLTHRNIVSNAYATRSILRMHPGDRLVSILPLAHTYECTLGLVAVVLQGAFVSYLDKPPTATVLLPAVKLVRPTIMISVPLIMEKIFRSSFLPVLQKKSVYRFGWGRRILNFIAGIKLKRLFGGRLDRKSVV